MKISFNNLEEEYSTLTRLSKVFSGDLPMTIIDNRNGKHVYNITSDVWDTLICLGIHFDNVIE